MKNHKVMVCIIIPQSFNRYDNGLDFSLTFCPKKQKVRFFILKIVKSEQGNFFFVFQTKCEGGGMLRFLNVIVIALV